MMAEKKQRQYKLHEVCIRLAEGMSLGSAAAFMITGPATKITNLGALKAVLGIRHFVIYWLYVIAFSLFAGVLINLF